MYRQMATIRAFDQRAVAEFHAGNIPDVVHASIGQEAVAVGVCTALRLGDKIQRPCVPQCARQVAS